LFEYIGLLVAAGIFLFCLCRCCGRCGGKVVNYRRRPAMKACLIGFLVFGTLVFLAGSGIELTGVILFNVNGDQSRKLAQKYHDL